MVSRLLWEQKAAGSNPVVPTKLNSTPFSRQNYVKKGVLFMPKFSVDFKLKVIEAYKNHEPLPKVEGTKEVSMVRNAQDWTLLYKTKGIEGISNDTIFRNYTLKDKVKAVKLVLKGKTYSEVGRIMGTKTHSTVRSWYLAYMKDGVAGLQYKKGIKVSTSVDISTPMKKRLSKGEREELLALRKRNEILELENEYLKKLDALVSKREEEEAKAKKQK